MMKYKALTLLGTATLLLFATDSYAACNYPSDTDSAGRRCGGRAASVIPGGNLGGNGRYQDSQGRQRVYGRNNDKYDRNSSINSSNRGDLGINQGFNNNLQPRNNNYNSGLGR